MNDDIVHIEVNRTIRDAFKKYLLLRYQCQRGKMREEINRALVEFLRDELGEETTEALLKSDEELSGVDIEPLNSE